MCGYSTNPGVTERKHKMKIEIANGINEYQQDGYFIDDIDFESKTIYFSVNETEWYGGDLENYRPNEYRTAADFLDGIAAETIKEVNFEATFFEVLQDLDWWKLEDMNLGEFDFNWNVEITNYNHSLKEEDVEHFFN